MFNCFKIKFFIFTVSINSAVISKKSCKQIKTKKVGLNQNFAKGTEANQNFIFLITCLVCWKRYVGCSVGLVNLQSIIKLR